MIHVLAAVEKNIKNAVCDKKNYSVMIMKNLFTFTKEYSGALPQLVEDDIFSPCPVDGGDEIFPNGIFEFNITKIIDHIQRNPDSITIAQIIYNKKNKRVQAGAF